MQVHQTSPAPPALAGWVQTLLAPVVAACRISSPPPVELRQTGDWGGWCSHDRTGHPDGRIQVTSRAVFWSQKCFVTTYVHETAHRILSDSGPPDFAHNPTFFGLQLVLFLRMDSENVRVAGFGGGWANCARLYDLQDPPECLSNEPINVWLPRCLGWAMDAARELAESDFTAEECAFELISRCQKWCAMLEKEPEIRAAAVEFNRKKSAAIQDQISALVSKSRERFWAAAAGWVLFFFSLFCLTAG